METQEFRGMTLCRLIFMHYNVTFLNTENVGIFGHCIYNVGEGYHRLLPTPIMSSAQITISIQDGSAFVGRVLKGGLAIPVLFFVIFSYLNTMQLWLCCSRLVIVRL
jgi:hypothetical protein